MDGQVSLFVFYGISVFVSHVSTDLVIFFIKNLTTLRTQSIYSLCILKLNSTRIPHLTFQPKTPSRAFDCGIE
jgi:hypothetical protein